MPGKLRDLGSIGILILCFSLGLAVLVVLLSFIFQLDIRNFFIEIRENRVGSVVYNVFLYILILGVVQYRAKAEDLGGIRELGFSWNESIRRRILILLFTITVCWSVYFSLLIYSRAAQGSFFSGKAALILLQGLVFGFLFSLVEEILFRGFILQVLLRSWSEVSTFCISSFLFLLVHLFCPGPLLFKLLYGTGLFLLGFTLAKNRYEYQSLWVPIAMHSMLITGMYLFSSVLVLNPERYAGMELIWGMRGTPLAGLVGIIILLVLLGISICRKI